MTTSQPSLSLPGPAPAPLHSHRTLPREPLARKSPPQSLLPAGWWWRGEQQKPCRERWGVVLDCSTQGFGHTVRWQEPQMGSFKAHGVTGGPGVPWGRRLSLGRQAGEKRSYGPPEGCWKGGELSQLSGLKIRLAF